jgi:transcriptional regulator with XRE-family HTH domain
MADRSELSEFLRSRRARITPEAAGLPALGPRRVPGLRREELAALAGVSVDYYVRLEQGRDVHPSEGVVEAIARALQLDDAERSHFARLVRPRPARRTAPPPERVRPGVRRLLDALTATPAFVLGRRMDVLAWNRLAAALVCDFAALEPAERNMVRLTFLDDAARELYPDFDAVAEETVAHLRLAAGRHPDDPRLAALVGELSVKSPEFRTLWARHDVRQKAHGRKRLLHPLVGELALDYETLALPGDGDQVLVTYTAEPGSASQSALELLGSLTAATPAVGS